MKNLSTCLLAACMPFLSIVGHAADVNFFPPAPEAKSVDDFDATGFTIDGKRTFLASGSFHYARAPRALWHDRLLRLKRAGFNTVQTYVFCNYHEPAENSFDFTVKRTSMSSSRPRRT